MPSQPQQVYTLCEEINLSDKEQDYKELADALSVTISIGVANASYVG